jgi:glutamate 5-kinase
MKPFTWQRAVIKVGSSLIAPDEHRCSATYLLPLAHFITASLSQGKEIILVSSGSVAAGRSKINHHHRPSIAEKQAMAAIGQMQMMANWQRFFDIPCAQVLLTADDLHNRRRYVNIQNTLRELLNNKALPVVNENDTVAVSELKVGDNDNLAAYTALVAQADTLIICSDIDGLFTADPRKDSTAQLMSEVVHIDDTTYAIAGGAGSSVGTGGMRTKIEAADKCTKSGIQALIVNGRQSEVFDKLLEGRIVGTHFLPALNKEKARTNWIRHTLKSAGEIHINQGAKQALVASGASLLPAGVISVTGDFKPGEAVDIVYENHPVAKGICLYSSVDMTVIKGLKSDQIEQKLGFIIGDAAVHRDNLVLV